MRRAFLLASNKPMGLCLAACLLLPTCGLAQHQEPRHLQEARQFVKFLALDQTEYRHKETMVRWQGVDGAQQNEARTDCSGFLDALLSRSYGLTREDFRKWMGRPRPLANTYYDLINIGKGFAKIATVSEVLPGDILAIHYPAGNEDTGHVMLVSGVPRQRTASAPLEPGTVQWEVKVIDASKSGHGKTDTRHKPDGSFAGGVGEGLFRLYTDKTGRILGYSWSTAAKSEYRGQDQRPLVVGRFDPRFKP